VARRAPEVARQEILDAAAYLLHRLPFREISIGDLMEHTKIGRSAFYVYFKDIYAVVDELMAGVRDEVLAYAETWKTEDMPSDQALRAFLADTVNMWVVQGQMISAIMDASVESPEVEKTFAGVMDIYQGVLKGILVREHEAGQIRSMDFDEIAAVLVIGTNAYLKARMGHGGRRGDPLKVVATLQEVWSRTIYFKTAGDPG
jgi:TetR/AcrR family transcriptional regulator, ethionamide resistance regulator